MPELQTEQSRLDQLAEEFAERYRRGERPAVSEYVRENPDLAEQIQDLFPALAMMEQVDHDLRNRAAPPDRSHPAEPSLTRLGDFRIIREVGRGGMGIVYEAEQVSLGRRVALKVLPKQTLLDTKYQQRFLREAKAAARLHHTNIVPVFGVGQQDGLHYYVMQFIHGLGLDEVLVELQRLRELSGERVECRELRVECNGAAREVSAVAVANSLMSGHFARTLLVDEESDQPSAVSDQPTALSTLDSGPSTPSSHSTLNSQHSTGGRADTVVGQLSDTFPGHSVQSTRSHSRQIYWQSVARIGLQAAQALQYAHDQGIIHRDVKPANLLLDTRGSVWVTDFGLAKSADQQDLTHTGDVLGTLRYMAPEQFDGNADARSDVFSLGLTLYELLALKPAFDERDRNKLIKQVTTCAPLRLRSIDSHIPRDLETVIHKAIDRDPSHRYQTADEMAADLQRYLGDEPIRARWVSPVTRIARWCRRNPVVASLTGTVAILLIFAGALVLQAGADRARVIAEVDVSLKDVDRLVQNRRWPEALAAAERADAAARSGGAGAATRERVGDALSGLLLVQRLDEARQLESNIAGGGFDCRSAARAYARAFSEFGVNVEDLTVEQAAQQIQARSGIVAELAVGLTDWARLERMVCACEGRDDARWQSLLALADAIDPDEWRRRLRAAWKAPLAESQQLRELANSGDVAAMSTPSVVLLARLLRDRTSPDEAVELLSEAQRRRPDDFWINFDLAESLSRCTPPRRDDALVFYHAALALRPDHPAVLNNMGILLNEQGKHDNAVACYARALATGADLPLLHSNLAVTLTEQGKLDEAAAAHRRAIELAPESAFSHSNLGWTLREQGKLEEAVAACRRAVALDPKFANARNNLASALEDQGDIEAAMREYRLAFQLDENHANSHNNLGHLLFHQGRLPEAIAELRTAIALDPDYAEAHANLGGALRLQGDFDEALPLLYRAIELDPEHAPAHNNLGYALADLGRHHEAVAEYRLAIHLDPLIAEPHLNLGVALADLGKLEEAIAEYHKAIKLDPDDPAAYFNLGNALNRLNRLDDAVAEYRRAIEVAPDMPEAHYNLGNVLNDQRRFDEAIVEFRTVIALDPTCGEAHNNLGQALEEQGFLDEAMEEYRAAILVNPNLLPPHRNLGLALRAQGLLDEAVEEYRAAIRIDPDYAPAHTSLGVALYERGDLDGAVAALHAAFEITMRIHGPEHESTQMARTNLAGIATNWSWALATAANESERDPNKAVSLARLAADLLPDDANHWNNLGVAHYRRGDFQSAIDAFERADALLGGGDRAHRMFFAMAHWRLDRRERARDLYAQGAAWIAEGAESDEEQRHFRAEAERLMGIDVAAREALIQDVSHSIAGDAENER